MNWDTIQEIAKYGALIALSYLLIKDIVKRIKRPVLKLSGLNVKTWVYETTRWFSRAITIEVRNNKKQAALKCIAYLKIIETPSNIVLNKLTYILHWADMPYTYITTGAQYVDIGSAPQRLDIAFTRDNLFTSGCWVGTPLAFSIPSPDLNHDFLPQGIYKVEIELKCENGKGCRRKFVIYSPQDWAELSVKEI